MIKIWYIVHKYINILAKYILERIFKEYILEFTTRAQSLSNIETEMRIIKLRILYALSPAELRPLLRKKVEIPHHIVGMHFTPVYFIVV